MALVNPEKRIIDMTAREFVDVLAEVMRQSDSDEREEPKPFNAKRFVYGIGGIAQLFNCSMTTANRIKQSGKIDDAISQCGRMITVDADLALQLMKKNQQ